MKLAGMSEFGDLVQRLNRAEAMIRQLQGNAPMDIQSIFGLESVYSSNFAGGPVTNVQLNTSTLCELSYTPPVPAWWEVTLCIGIVDKVDSAYHYMYGGPTLTTPDEDGQTSLWQVLTQNNAGPSDFGPRSMSGIYKLAAGQSYTVRAQLGGGSGGTWRYYRAPSTLWMYAKAFARGDA